MRKCSKCRSFLELNSFNKGKCLDGYHPWCKPCVKHYDKARHTKNKNKINKRKRVYRRELRFDNQTQLIKHFLNNPCVDCGERNPILLEFDHRSDKEVNISSVITRWSWKRLKEEVSKCDVRCANCHRRKTAIERDFSMLEHPLMVLFENNGV